MTTQLAAGLTQAKDRGGAGRHANEYAEALITAALLPKKITPYEIERYYRKAHRVGAWRTLPKEARALLLTARKVIKTLVKGPALRAALLKIFLKIELQTLRGRALLHGIKIMLSLGYRKVLNTLRGLREALILGIQYLNNPPMYRAYG